MPRSVIEASRSSEVGIVARGADASRSELPLEGVRRADGELSARIGEVGHASPPRPPPAACRFAVASEHHRARVDEKAGRTRSVRPAFVPAAAA